MLYRPRWPSLRAQALQVFHSAHALAARGVDVTVAYHPGEGDLYGFFGLPPLPTLNLLRLPRSGTAASLAFRGHVLAWARRPGVFLAREKRLAAWVLRRVPRRPVVLEAHEVDSLQGRPTLALERLVLSRAAGLLCNCEGVRNGLAWMHDLPAVVRVVHNASRPPVRRPRGHGVVYAGSLLTEKDVETVARAAPALGGVTLLGPHEPARLAALQRLADGALALQGPVPPVRLLEVLSRFEVGLVPLGRGWFGSELTSPLKAFSYRAAGVAVVGARSPALRRALGDGFAPYRRGSPEDLVAAVARARADWERQRALPVRTWEARAAEVQALLQEVA